MEKSSSLTVSSAVALDLYDGLFDLDYIMETDHAEIGFNRSDLLNIEKRLPADIIEKLWTLANKRCAPEHLGLIIGGRLNEESKGMISNLVISSKNLREAVTIFEKYIPVMSEIEKIELVPVIDGIKIFYRYSQEKFYHHRAICRSMSAGVTWARYLTGKNIFPLETGFKQKNINNPQKYIDCFGDACKFGADDDYLIVSNEDLKIPISTSNEYLKKILLEKVDNVKDCLNKTGYVSRAVRSVIEENLHLGVVTSEFVAKELNVSRQTLHRKLSSEGLNFSHLVSDVRKEMAQYHLEKGCKLDRLSELLGFSEPSAFFKAFKTWFDTTPRRYISK